MPLDFDILDQCGTTNERLREFFTAKPPTKAAEKRLSATKEGKEKLQQINQDVIKRKEFEDMIGGWLQENICLSLKNHKLHSAVDMAWDSAPINKYNLPLLQFAQGRIDTSKVESVLKEIPNGEKYVKKNDAGQVVGIDLPKFTDMNVNLVRSVISRRVAAQTSRYDLWPHFKYESRDGTQVGRVRADMTSQRMDIMADQYGYTSFEEQVCRDMLLYPNGSFAFPRCAWERDVQWRKKGKAEEFQAGEEFYTEAVVVREGVAWVNPHPARVFYDNNYSAASLNTDTGCEYVGFWDIERWGNIRRNPAYFNQDSVGFSSDSSGWFSQHLSYLSSCFDKIVPPTMENPSDQNERKTNVGFYSVMADDVSVFFSNLWVKIIPSNWNIGTYPYPIWIHLKCAGDNTVVYADRMPSGPCSVFRFNCNDGRLNNISMAHELMQYQDQLTNLYSQLLRTIQADLFAVGVLNEDIFPAGAEGDAAKAAFKSVMQGGGWQTQTMQVLTCSFEKLSQLHGKEITPDMVFKVVRSSPNTAITAIFEAIARVVAMAERLLVMSAHESGQAATHEISATESNQIATSTDAIYNFISAAMDRGRAAMKRICYESVVACGTDEIVLPVSKRYPKDVVTKAGFKVLDKDDARDSDVGYITVTGSKQSLVHDYIFTSRDGSNRASNTAAASALVQLITPFVTSNPSAQNAILSAMGKEKLFELINAVFRLTDAGVDLNLELKPGEDDALLLEDDQQVMALLQQLAASVKQNTADIAKFQQAVGGGMPQPPGQ